MVAKILLSLLLLVVATELVCAQCSQKLCPVVTNSNPRCKGKLQYQCVCDFTCSEWDKPCNWVLTCPAEINDINNVRDKKNKLNLLRLPKRNRQECLDININTHKHPNCCNLFCKSNFKDVCF
ncbi:uncharacterized protein LOC6540874 [Drosophila erecta]|uniref:Uncharacterized protein n=1 Tax=Drosophila erecta TaxID=7220 RepID=B3NAR9_DROER|nr:uncharacterized protein LOC6540874 [Drosophila erecta]EDV57592.1 uncharacterized protein Dere_GG24925 [Drosophila erecta]